MNSKPSACDVALLRRSLDESLSVADEDALEVHLSDCVDCRRQLETLAAESLDWERVGEVLKSESNDACARSRFGPRDATDETIGFDNARLDSAFSTDFAVDFLDPPTQPESLGRIADVDILEIIGHGGMGIVLKGFQAALNRPVAVKVLAPHLATSGAARQRFAREAQAAAAIVHPNVMPIFTVDASGKLPYLVMPYINGESLQARIDRTGCLPTIDVLRIGLQVARALAAAHAQGLVHRDVKPANILLDRGVDRVLLTDFGLARAADDASLTRTGFIAGTPQYMSPEQARGDSIDARSDLFSLGSVMYAMCTARPPFRADSSYGILRRITDYEPRPIRDIEPSVPEWLANLVNRLLAKRTEERYQSADQVADMMETCLAHLQQPNSVLIPESLVARRALRPFPVVPSMIAASALFLASVGVWSWQAGLSPTFSSDNGTDRESRSVIDAERSDLDESVSQVSIDPTNDAWTSDAELSEQMDSTLQRALRLRRQVDDFWD